MRILFSLPILVILLILQTTIAGHLSLISGVVDLTLVWLAAWGLNSRDNSGYFLASFSGLLVAYITALPWYVYLAAYCSVIILAKFVMQRQWQAPLMTMFMITMVSSIFLYGLSIMALRVAGVNYQLESTIDTVVIPSIFLNLFFAIPVFAIVRDFSHWVYHTEGVV